MDFTNNKNDVNTRREKKNFSLDIAEVVSVPSDNAQTVTIRRLGDEGGVIGAPALIPAKGDVGLPSPGDIVVIGFAIGGQRIVLGVLYEDDAPEYKRGARVIGHSETDTEIRITPNGDLELNGPVHINSYQVFVQPNEPENPEVGDVWIDNSVAFQ